MTQFDDHDLPEELREVVERLRASRPSLSAHEREQLKLRVMASSSEHELRSARRRRRFPVRSRVLALVLATMLIGGTAAGGIAAGGSGSSPNAAAGQYCKKIPTQHPPCN